MGYDRYIYYAKGSIKVIIRKRWGYGFFTVY
jgi:hypothetical protein